MSVMPSNISRVSQTLLQQASTGALGRTQVAMLRVQQELATGRSLWRYSDDAVRAAAVAVLTDRLQHAEQQTRNLNHADTALAALDQALADAHELVQEARAIASGQVGTGTTPEERRSQALVVDSIIASLVAIANRASVAGHMFAGSTPGTPALESFLGGYRYTGHGPGVMTDLGLGSPIPLTLAGAPLAGVSSRVEGSVDLNPALTADTRVADLNGARGRGVRRGQIEMAFGDMGWMTVDLSEVDTVRDVLIALERAIRRYEQERGVRVLGPDGVGTRGGRFVFDVHNDGRSPPSALQFRDVGSSTTAQDLGLAAEDQTVRFTPTRDEGRDVDPRLTWRTPIEALEGLDGSLGQVRVVNLGRSAVVDLSGARTLEDVRNAFLAAGLGVRVDINAAGTALRVVNDVVAGRAGAMAIEEVAGQGQTATRLGIRTLSAATQLADFNDGRGVRIVSGQTDPTTGLPDPTRDVDFTIRLGDPAGTVIAVDLRPTDLASVGAVLARINEAAAAAGLGVPADFHATLSDDANGIVLRQNPAWSAMRIEPQNNSPAAEDLGLLGGVYDPDTGAYRGEDRARVRVDGVLTWLMDLREALLADDTSGIALAGERLDASATRLAEARAQAGAWAARVRDATRRQEDLTVLDQQMLSLVRDTDFAAAATRLSLLQTQLTAALAVSARSLSRTLLDFLG